jgi:predicted DCC family thiol-disulfide oxidoreductase YuxK
MSDGSFAGSDPEDRPMRGVGPAAASPGGSPAVFLFDGDCAFCSSCARFIERRIPTAATVAAWQLTDLAALGVAEVEAAAAVVWVEADRGGHVAGPAAIARLLDDAGSWWRPLGWLLSHPPVRWVGWPVYRLVARNRHRMPGGTAACAIDRSQRDASDHRA